MFCSSCGTENPSGGRFCNSCGAPLGSAVPTGHGAAAAPAPAAARPVAGAGSPDLASLGARALAALLDLFLVVAFCVAALVWAAARWGTVTAAGANVEGLPGLFLMLACGAAAFAYFALLEGTLGATLGKLVFNVQVQDKSGRRAGLSAAVVRTLARIVDGLMFYLVGLLVAAFSKMRQRVGDHLAGTLVVRRQWNAALRGLALVLWLAGFAAAVWMTMSEHGAARKLTPAVTTPVELGPAGFNRDGSGGSPAGTTTPAGSATAELASGDYRMSLTWLERKGGPPRAAAPYRPGDDVAAKYQITGYGRDNNRIDLDLAVVPVDPSGVPMDEPWTQSLRQTVAEDAPINGSYKFTVPYYAPPGSYRISVKVTDNIRNTTAEFTPTLEVVRDAPLAPAAALEVRNFQFSDSKGGPALAPAAYRAGRTVYWAFDVAGMQFSADSVDVKIAFELVGPDGKTVVDQPDWLHISNSFSYHPATFFVPVNGRIAIPGDTDAGSYKARFRLTDQVANSTTEYEGGFEVQ